METSLLYAFLKDNGEAEERDARRNGINHPKGKKRKHVSINPIFIINHFNLNYIRHVSIN